MKKTLALLLAACMGLSLVACAAAPAPAAAPAAPAASAEAPAESAEPAAEAAKEVITGSISHSSAPDSTYDIGAHKFADLVAEYTNGTVQLEVYPSAQLGSDKEAFEGHRMGSVDFSLPGASMLSQYKSNVAVFNLPFLFSSREDAYKVLDSDLAAEIFSSTEEVGVKVLACLESGFRQVASSKKPIMSVEDLQGQKIRVPDGDLYVNTWKALGVNPTVLAWNECFSALQTGIIDGEEAPMSSFDSAGFSEIVKYFSFINYMYDPVCLCVSTMFWDQLDAEQQEAVQKAAKEASAFERAYCLELEQTLQSKLEGEGVSFYEPDLAGFQSAVQSVYDGYADQETLKKVLELLGR